jgi:hypothetical protein
MYFTLSSPFNYGSIREARIKRAFRPRFHRGRVRRLFAYIPREDGLTAEGILHGRRLEKGVECSPKRTQSPPPWGHRCACGQHSGWSESHLRCCKPAKTCLLIITAGELRSALRTRPGLLSHT